MIIALLLSVTLVSVLIFFAGYRLGAKYSLDDLHFMLWMIEQDKLEDNATGEPIWSALERERGHKYADELSKPFTNEN